MIEGQLATIIFLSLKVAAMAILIATPLAVFIGYALARWRFTGHWLLNAIVYMPLVLPPVVTGFILLKVFGPKGVGGEFFSSVLGIEFGFRWTGAALAAGIVAFPLIVRPIKLAFESIEQSLIDDAGILGAKPFFVFCTIALPLALPGIIVGAVLGFAKAMGDFGATITFVSNIPGETQTMSLGIYALMQSPDGDRDALMLVLIMIAISLVTIVVSAWLSYRFSAK
ncbi:MAG: molybdate ABC transporter permease subunit, partial [Rhizobiaceae bacterium]|nr:molybdate ABC transporter permease subunit [Rhizobiaceae bacterium]